MENSGNLTAESGLSNWSVAERYTPAACRALEYAKRESLRRGASAITVADLLAGLGVDEDSRAERTGSLKANAFYLRWLTGLPALPAAAADSIELSIEDPTDFPRFAKDLIGEWLEQSRLELDNEARRAIGFALAEADRDREYWIDSDHLLRGILRFPNRAHFAILKIEINLASARAASRNDRRAFPPHQTPSIKVVKYLVRKHLALWVPPILGLACYLYILMQGVGLTASPLAR
ncbi:MAG TPA: hypothetical protein VHZ52_11220 [Acidobacteriaceae bacterium]|jgi:hypothetical protein|nr:hypothetical protein [Acidobacteriaceae bacterium]